MSKLANFFLMIAKIIAGGLGSGLQIEIQDNHISYQFKRKKDTEARLWENHYANAAIYLKDSVQPVRIDPESELGDLNVKTTNYLKTFMEQEAIERAFNALSDTESKIQKLLFIAIGCVIGMGLLQIVVSAQ